MNLDPEGSKDQLEEYDTALDTADVNNRDIAVEIEDGDGQIAKMTIPRAGSASNTAKS